MLVFCGKQIITPGSLEELTGTSQYKADNSVLHEQERDICKLWKGLGVNLVVAGIENQTKACRDMPFRIIGYDGASYRSQLLKKENQHYEAVTFTEQEKEEGVKMCKVLDFREQRGKALGEEIGKKAGEKRFRDLLCVLSKQGYQLEEIIAVTAKEEDVERLYKQYKLA